MHKISFILEIIVGTIRVCCLICWQVDLERMNMRQFGMRSSFI